MTLEQFCRGRLVVLRPTATACEAARAMADNHVGAVLVVGRAGLLGIVTDRDLTLKIVAADFKPSRLALRQVMTPNPMTLDRTETVEKAVTAMHGLHVRRLVVVDGAKPVGIVTLDDLLLTRAVHVNRLRDVVLAQLSEPSRAKPEGLTGPKHLYRRPLNAAERSRQHRSQTMRAFTDHVKKVTGLQSDADARAAFEVVASGLAQRLNAHEARAFLAQLPALVREQLGDASYAGPDRKVTRLTIEREMERRLKVWPQRAAELVSRIGHAMGEFVSAGELQGLQSQLPAELRPLLQRAA